MNLLGFSKRFETVLYCWFFKLDFCVLHFSLPFSNLPDWAASTPRRWSQSKRRVTEGGRRRAAEGRKRRVTEGDKHRARARSKSRATEGYRGKEEEGQQDRNHSTRKALSSKQGR